MIHPYLHAVVALVEQTGELILPYWRRELAVFQKADASPVTAADLAAHRALAEGLTQLDATIPVLSEEDCAVALAERASWTRWWLVDPLDGTQEFIAGSPEFTVNVALIEQGRVVFGVVGVPATGRCYYGGQGVGSWVRNAAGEVQPLNVRQQMLETFTLVASRRHSSAAQEHLLSALRQQFGGLELVNVGSSLKFCLIAEGSADCYPRLAPTSQWDTAAAQGVLEGAAGLVLDINGLPLAYPAQKSYLNPYFIALPASANWCPELLSAAHQAATLV